MAEFRRKNPGVDGESKIEIREINMNQSCVNIDVLGQKVPLYPLKIDMPSGQVKCYVIIEKLFEKQVTMIDLVYGNIDIEGMEKNPDIRKRYMEALSRENIEIITRKYMGAMPPVLPRAIGQLDANLAVAVAAAVKQSAYSEIRTITTQINDMFPNKDSGESIFKSFMKFATRNNPKNTSTGLDYPGNPNSKKTHTVKEGIIFYPAGAVIIGGRMCSKFNYCTKDSETGIRTEVDNFLVSGANLDKLSYDEFYRKRFVQQICVPSRLKNTRGKKYPYIGHFNEQGQFENDFSIFEIVSTLREEADTYPKY